jgi:hypothetical protein
MLHVATVHWQEDRWIEPQLRFMRRNLPEHRIYASLNGIDIDRFGHEFHYAADMPGDHHVKLNALAEMITAEADPEDLLLFIDSDAFPIAPVDEQLLGGMPLAAVRRDENAMEPMPHPCFCLTTVGFWNEIEGDWGQGKYFWTAPTGDQVTDGGANLLAILEERGLSWRPLLRSNRRDLDPVFFGVYADHVYHHGAGSRPPILFRTALDAKEATRGARDAALIPERVPVLGRLERSVRYRLGRRREQRKLVEYQERSARLSDEVFAQILVDDAFYRQFIDAPEPLSI